MTSDACLPAVRASPKSRLRPNDILYFRYWLIVQGWTVFERSVANPDTLADLPVIQAAAAGAVGIECEAVRSITLEVYRAATSEQLPEDAFTIGHPELDADWDDFDDRAEMQRRLPRLTALCWPDV